MTHHKRWGGRFLELFLMFCLIGLTVALIVGGFVGGAYVAHNMEVRERDLALLGALLGGIVSRVLWRRLLKIYKYSSDLKPIADD